MSPSGPCFVTGPRGYFRLECTYTASRKAKLLAFLNGFYEKSIVFDAAGRKWKSIGTDSRWKRSWWLVLLANTVFNPRIDIKIAWADPQPYPLDELKRAYAKAVDSDDDILTQFSEPDGLKKKIAEAQSFDDLVAAYKTVEEDGSEETTIA